MEELCLEEEEVGTFQSRLRMEFHHQRDRIFEG
jgi:hypothetical protein